MFFCLVVAVVIVCFLDVNQPARTICIYKVSVGDLQDILEIDKASLLVTVQPGVTIGLLNRYLSLFA